MSDPKPKAREGLLTTDHRKGDLQFVSILDPLHGTVTLLEPWEHAILVLCDGNRNARQILEVIHPIEGETVDLKAVQRTLKWFEAQDVIEPCGLANEVARPPGPRTLAALQQAYREWHKDPVKTTEILSGIFTLPADMSKAQVQVGLDPTVALPDEENGSHPVAIGTTLVVGDGDGEEEDGRSMISLLGGDLVPPKPPRREEPETLVGSLAGSEAAIDADDFVEDELELGGKLSDLLAAVDNDFAEVEKREQEAKQKKTQRPKSKVKSKKTPPPVGKPIGGIAEVPRAKSLEKPDAKVWLAEVQEKPPTLVIPDPFEAAGPLPVVKKEPSKKEPSAKKEPKKEPSKKEQSTKIPRAPTLPPVSEASLIDEPTMKSISYPELGSDLVVSSREKSAKIPASKPRNSKVGDRVGAVVAAEPTTSQRNVSAVGREVVTESDKAPTLEDTLPYVEAATEGRVRTHDPRDDVAAYVITEPNRSGEPATSSEEPPTNPAASEHIAPGRAREVFERLRKAGLKARSYSDDSLDLISDDAHPARRKDDKAARRFEQALVSLTEGDLELALAHFRALFDQMPDSKRVRGFIEAIESVRGDQAIQPSILDDFEAALEDAIAYGRCPKCFSMMAPDEAECFACGFRLSRTI